LLSAGWLWPDPAAPSLQENKSCYRVQSMQQCLIWRIRAGAIIFENFYNCLWKSPRKSFFENRGKSRRETL